MLFQAGRWRLLAIIEVQCLHLRLSPLLSTPTLRSLLLPEARSLSWTPLDTIGLFCPSFTLPIGLYVVSVIKQGDSESQVGASRNHNANWTFLRWNPVSCQVANRSWLADRCLYKHSRYTEQNHGQAIADITQRRTHKLFSFPLHVNIGEPFSLVTVIL